MTILYLDVNSHAAFGGQGREGAGAGASPVIPYFTAARTGSLSRARFSDA
jgi:hypothetical protein